MEIPASTLDPKEAYGLLTACIVPRPIAWVSTVDAQGRVNLAPFSYFTGVCSDPPTLAISIGNRPDGTPKDTYRNLLETGVFCVNLVEAHQVKAMNESSAPHPPGVDELALAGLDTRPCQAIAGVRVARARVALECRFLESHAHGSVHLTLGEVVHAFVDDAVALPEKRRPDLAKLEPIARLGGPTYAYLGERFVLQRPKAP